MNLKDVHLALALPSYDGSRLNSRAIIQAVSSGIGSVIPMEASGSLLAHVFNRALCLGFEAYQKGKATHFLMLHSDIIPDRDDWLTVFLKEFFDNNAQLMSAVVPIKNESGLSSTAVEGASPWGPRRLTSREIAKLPNTFTMDGLLLNTGMMIFALGEAWPYKCWFEINDKIEWVDGKPVAVTQPEDWNFSRQARANGCKRIFATKAVPLKHVGPQHWPNTQAWGEATDTAKLAMRPDTSDQAVYHQIFEEEQYADVLGKMEFKAIIDAGANIGLSTVWLARQFPKATVVAIEPDLENFAVLERNVNENNARAYLIPGALWSTDGHGKMVDDGNGKWAMRVVPDATGTVGLMTMDRAISMVEERVKGAHMKLERPCLVKMDIEGAEAEVFRDHEWLRKVDMLAIEIHGEEADDVVTAALHRTKRSYSRWVKGEVTFIQFEGP